MAPRELVQKTRLEECFGEAGAKVILEHMKELDQTFGMAGGKIILGIMQGEYRSLKEI